MKSKKKLSKKKLNKIRMQRLQNVARIAIASLILCALRLPETNATFTSKKNIEENSVKAGYWVKPSVEVISPNGGEEYEVNEEITIRWEAQSSDPGSSIVSDLYFSNDAGANYTLIASDLEDIFTYVWTLPSVKSDQMMMKVEVEDEHGLTNSDESDAVFDPVVKDDESKKDSSEEEDKDGAKNDGGNDPTIVTPTETPAPTVEPVASESTPLPSVEAVTPAPEPVIEPTTPPVEEETPAPEPTVESSDSTSEPESSQDTSPAPNEGVQDVVQ